MAPLCFGVQNHSPGAGFREVELTDRSGAPGPGQRVGHCVRVLLPLLWVTVGVEVKRFPDAVRRLCGACTANREGVLGSHH